MHDFSQILLCPPEVTLLRLEPRPDPMFVRYLLSHLRVDQDIAADFTKPPCYACLLPGCAGDVAVRPRIEVSMAAPPRDCPRYMPSHKTAKPARPRSACEVLRWECSCKVLQNIAHRVHPCSR